jgi:tRNA(Ile)-lysidine synthase
MLLEKINSTIKHYHLLSKGDSLVVAVSGGPDSMALVYALDALRDELKLRLHIAHLDHCLRLDSARDKEYVESVARKLNLPFTATQVNIRGLAKKGSIEQICRNARLGFLFRVARTIKAKKIALGHNLDDQAETVLMRILRGTGLYGLAGILPKREIAGFWIIRPLIEVRRKEIQAFLKRKKIKPLLDKTNLEDIYFRNKVRNRLIPLLEKEYNQNIKEVLANLAQSAGCDYAYLLQQALRFRGAGRRRLNLAKLAKLHPAMQRLLIRQAIAELKGDTRRITFRHLKEIEDLLFRRPVNSIVDLPSGISVAKNKSALFFYGR